MLAEHLTREREFKNLCRQVAAFIALMDSEMKKPSNEDRGKRIADLCNKLEIANDYALRFGLDLERKGMKFRKVRR